MHSYFWVYTVVVGIIVVLVVSLRMKKNKKIKEFQALLEKVVEDFVITNKETEELKGLKEKLKLSNRATTKIAEEIYSKSLILCLQDDNLSEKEKEFLSKLEKIFDIPSRFIATEAIKSYDRVFKKQIEDRKLTDDEEKLLDKLKEDLKLSDKMIVKNLKELERLKLLTKIQEGKLPVVATNMILQKGETCHWTVPAKLCEERVISRRYEGGYSGVSFRIARGVSFRTGGFRGHPVVQRGVVEVDSGNLTITNKRTVFRGIKKTAVFPYKKVVDIQLFKDAFQITKEGRSKAQFLKVDDMEVATAIISEAVRRFVS